MAKKHSCAVVSIAGSEFEQRREYKLCREEAQCENHMKSDLLYNDFTLAFCTVTERRNVAGYESEKSTLVFVAFLYKFVPQCRIGRGAEPMNGLISAYHNGGAGMKKGQVVEGVVRKVKFPNDGLVEIPGEKEFVIVKNTIPGQKVRASVNKIRRGQAEGRLLEVLERAQNEIEPPCPHFGACGGCNYQNLSYDRQLCIKAEQVKDMLDHAVKGDYIWEGILPSPVRSEYRNKMEFSFGDEYKDGPMTLGMHKRNCFHSIVCVTNCRIVDGDYRQILDCTLKSAKESALPYYHRKRHTGFFRHLLVRKAERTGEILVDLITTSGREENNPVSKAAAEKLLNDWVNRLLALSLHGKIVGILHTVNDSIADTIKDEGTRVLYGKSFFYEEILGLKFKITPFSFFQTNSLGAELLYEKVRAYIGDMRDKTVFDLYSGTGTIAQILAPVAKRVVGVEIVEEAVAAAKENARLNELDNCMFWAGDVLKVIDGIGEVPDLIVLDPPRDGVHPKALEKIINFGVDRLVYIACKPTSLVRDLEVLQERGYQAERVGCVDLFPSTCHVETVALISKNKGEKEATI